MQKENQKIIVVERKILFEYGRNNFQGFKSHEEFDYESVILQNFENMRRGDAEHDSNYKQPIAYTSIVNPTTKQVFTYQRSKQDKNYHEKRLQGKWSWGLGGHIEPLDTKNENLLRESLEREVLKEEIQLKGEIENINILGYINDDSNSVGEVHFGILYVVKTLGDVIPKDSEITYGGFKGFEELNETCKNCNVESWSKIVLEPLRKYLEN